MIGRFPNVKFIGYVERRSNLPSLYACANIMLVHLRRSPEGAVSLPSRLLAYMACARPVLICCEGAPLNLIQAAACGYPLRAGKCTAMAAAIMRASGQRAELEQMGASGRQYYLEHLSESQTLTGCQLF